MSQPSAPTCACPGCSACTPGGCSRDRAAHATLYAKPPRGALALALTRCGPCCLQLTTTDDGPGWSRPYGAATGQIG